MIVQTDIQEKKTCFFSNLDSGDIFSYDYPPKEVLMKLATNEALMDENETHIRAIYLDNGEGYASAYDSDFVYPLTGKLIITG